MNLIEKARIIKLADFLDGPLYAANERTGGQKFDMEHWSNDMPLGVTKKHCGSSACAMGWATVVFPRSLKMNEEWVPVMRNNEAIHGEHIGPEFFGMTDLQADDAFLSGFNRGPKEEAGVLRGIAEEGN